VAPVMHFLKTLQSRDAIQDTTKTAATLGDELKVQGAILDRVAIVGGVTENNLFSGDMPVKKKKKKTVKISPTVVE